MTDNKPNNPSLAAFVHLRVQHHLSEAALAAIGTSIGSCGKKGFLEMAEEAFDGMASKYSILSEQYNAKFRDEEPND